MKPVEILKVNSDGTEFTVGIVTGRQPNGEETLSRKVCTKEEAKAKVQEQITRRQTSLVALTERINSEIAAIQAEYDFYFAD